MRTGKNMFILFSKNLNDFLGDTAGGVQIEYALIASLVSIAIFAAAFELGSSLNSTYNGFANSINTINSP